MDILRCPRCAKEIPDTSRFCRRCGSALAWRVGRIVLPPPPLLVPPPALPRSYDRTGAAVATAPARPPTRRSAAASKKSSGGGGWVILVPIFAGILYFNTSRLSARRNTMPATPRPVPSFDSSRYPYNYRPVTPAPTRPPQTYPKPLRSTPGGNTRVVPQTPTSPQAPVGPAFRLDAHPRPAGTYRYDPVPNPARPVHADPSH